jgi:hypothetical protein
MRQFETEHVSPECEGTLEIGNRDAGMIRGRDLKWLSHAPDHAPAPDHDQSEG